MKKEAYWTLYGVVLAFIVQVYYDAIGLYTSPALKVTIGIILSLVM